MRIITRLKIISTVTSVALLVLVPVLIWSFVDFRSAKRDFILASKIKDNFFERASLRDQYFLYREERMRAQWDGNKVMADALLRQAGLQFQNREERQILERLRENTENSAEIFHRIADNTKTLRSAGANRDVYQELDKRLYSQLLLKAAIVRGAAITLEKSSSQRIERTYRRLTVIIGFFALTLALSTILVAQQLGRVIRKRLAPLHAGARVIAGGDLGYRIECDGTDEFCELARSVNAMTDKLQAFTQRLGACRT